MALSDADTLALARSLWPAMTTAAVSDAFLTSYLPGVRSMVAAVRWGTLYDTACAHLLAHFAYRVDPTGTLNGVGASSPGGVTSRSTGALSVSYGSGTGGATGLAAADAFLASTAPGQAYLMLRDTRGAIVAPFMV